MCSESGQIKKSPISGNQPTGQIVTVLWKDGIWGNSSSILHPLVVSRSLFFRYCSSEAVGFQRHPGAGEREKKMEAVVEEEMRREMEKESGEGVRGSEEGSCGGL